MIKKITAIVIAFAFLAFLPLKTGSVNADDTEQKTTFVLPAALKSVEDEAFSYTAAKTVVFPEGFLYIGNRAFASSKNLNSMVIPASTADIADSAFCDLEDMIIYGVKGSYAQDWAEKNGVAFISGYIWSFLSSNRKKANHYIMQAQRIFYVCLALTFVNTVLEGQDKNKSRRPQDRPELNPIDYKFP